MTYATPDVEGSLPVEQTVTGSVGLYRGDCVPDCDADFSPAVLSSSTA